MLLTVVVAAWAVSEIVLGVARRATRRSASVRDRGSLALLWVVVGVGVTSGVFLQFVDVGRMTASPGALRSLALALLAAGLIVRWSAILTLRRFFNTNVAIQDGHKIVRSGPYRVIRHPSYSGLLLAFAGLGVAFGSWPSLAAVTLPITAAVLYRISVEERALVEAFGEQYIDYRATTKRLVPWVY